MKVFLKKILEVELLNEKYLVITKTIKPILRNKYRIW